MSLFKPLSSGSRFWQSSNSATDSKLFGFPVSTSIRGKCIPIVYGTKRVPLNLIWLGIWNAKPVGTKLKGGGGKGGNQQFNYFSDVMLAICQGPINAVGQMWLNNLHFYTSGGGTQVYAIPSGGGTFTPTFSNQLFIDAGVYIINSYGVSVNDFGAPGSATLAGAAPTPLTSVVGGAVSAITVTASGLYLAGSPNPTITFSGGGGGSGAIATCTLSPVGNGGVFEEILQGNIVLVSGGSGYTTPPTVTFNGGNISTTGAKAYATLANPTSGGGTIGAGQYYFNPSTGSYTFGPAMGGTTVQIAYVFNPVAINGETPTDGVGFSILTGDLGQAVWGYLESPVPPQSAPANATTSTLLFPGQGLGYSEVALAVSQQLALGSTGVLSNISLEVFGFGIWGGGIIDAPPFLPLPVATATIVGGAITAITLSNVTLPWYTSVPYVQIVGNGTGATAVAVLAGQVNTTSTAAIAPGLQTVTPAAITNIAVGSILTIDTGALQEQVTVTQQIGSTFEAVFVNAHTSGCTITDTAGQLASINVTAGGSGYTTASVYIGPLLQTAQQGIAFDLLTNPLYGCGASGTAQGFLPTDIGDLTDIGSYCIANGLFISMTLESQQSATEHIKRLLTVANGEGFWSEGVLKFRTYGDTSTAGNGMLFIPNTAPIYDLDADDFIVDGTGKAGVTVERPTVRDAVNRVTLEWDNRNNSYNSEPLDEYDQYAVDKFGLRPASTMKMDMITTQPVAQLVANVQTQRSCYIRNKYHFKLAVIYALLDPMDLVTLTVPELGLLYYPVRILSIEEDDKQCLQIEAEDFPWGTAKPTINPKEVASTFGPGYFATPGFTNPPMFVDLPEDTTQGNLYVLGIALSGPTTWGGCAVFISTDGGNSYIQIGRQNGAATMGVTTAILAAQFDPDLISTLAVYLGESFGALQSFTAAEWNSLDPLIAVDDELLAYQTAVLTSAFAYNITILHRGIYGTFPATHAVGAPFCVIDDAIFQWGYSASMIGKTVLFKFPAFNQYGQQEQDISLAVAYPYFVEGPRLPYPWNTNFAHQPGGNTDVLYPFSAFALQQTYVLNEDGFQRAQLEIFGYGTINVFSGITRPPAVVLLSSSTGGSIHAGSAIVVGVTVLAADNTSTPMTLQSFTFPAGTNTNTLTITATFFNMTDQFATIYMADDPEEGWSLVGVIVPPATAATITALPTEFLQQPPDQNNVGYAIRATADIHGGVWGGVIGPVASIGGGQCTVTVPGSTWTTNQMAGRIFTLLASQNIASPMEIINVPIVSNTATILTLGFDLVGGTQYIFPGDIVEIRTLATTFSSTTIGDSAFVNGGAGQSGIGLTVNAEAGNMVWIINGTGAGQQRLIISNTNTVLTVSSPFAVVPDATSIFIVIDPTWPYSTPSGLVPVAGLLTTIQMGIAVPNAAQGTFIVQVMTVDAAGETCLPGFAPFREIFQPGVGGTLVVTASGSQI